MQQKSPNPCKLFLGGRARRFSKVNTPKMQAKQAGARQKGRILAAGPAVALGASALALVILAGCGCTKPPNPDGPAPAAAGPVTLRLVCPEGGPAQLLDRYSRGW